MGDRVTTGSYRDRKVQVHFEILIMDVRSTASPHNRHQYPKRNSKLFTKGR